MLLKQTCSCLCALFWQVYYQKSWVKTAEKDERLIEKKENENKFYLFDLVTNKIWKFLTDLVLGEYFKVKIAQSAGAVDYTDCTSAEG